MNRASVNINLDRVIGEAHDHLYGANLEHLGQAIYGGVWAEMLRDRKFAGRDHMYKSPSEGLYNVHLGIGIVAPWEAANPDYEAVLYVHDNSVFYTGRQSQRITIRRPNGQAHGIKQGSLYLESERDYELCLVLKGQGQSLEVQLGDERWQIAELGDDWQSLQRTFTKAGADPKGELTLTIREGTAWIGCASLLPTDHVRGFRADVIAAMRDWSPTQLRWPGGNFVSAYHWEAGVGDRDKRPTYLDPAWWLWESNDVGTDEFVDLCRLVGAEPVLTANMGNGTPEEARAWVEYCNGETSTKYGAIRAANGYEEPHDVKVWFVGNEQYGNWQVGHVDAETYAASYIKFARAMRDADPELTLIGVGTPVDLYAHWNETVLRSAAEEMDQFSLHYYSVRTEKQSVTPAPEEIFLQKMAAWHEVRGMLDDTLAIVDQHSPKPLPIAFDEWNTYVNAKGPNFIEKYNLADALYTGSIMNLCLQRADRIKYSAIYNLTNVMGSYLIAPLYNWDASFRRRDGGWVPIDTGDDPARPAVIKMPATLVLELMTRHRGKQALETKVDCGTFASPPAGTMPAFDDVPLVNAAATFDAEANALFVSLVNCGMDEPTPVSIEGVDAEADVDMYLVSGASPLATNTFEAPDTVTVEHQTVPADQLVLPPHSFAMLILRLR